MTEVLQSNSKVCGTIADVTRLGLQHEQQHQELMLTDIKHVFSRNPLFPAFHEEQVVGEKSKVITWKSFGEGVHEFGHDGKGFAFDNETPRHRSFLQDYQLASRLSTCGEYMEFIDDGGYERPELWLSLGWNVREQNDWQAPLYWYRDGSQWHHFTLGGLQPIDQNLPVCHVSFFEADAFARWSERRLPTEFEWEHASVDCPMQGNFADSERFHPASATAPGQGLQQMFGDLWEWTNSQYLAYPGYRPLPGALGEYNGKFMCNQFVLRGGSCATSANHIRPTYRNFFPPEARWQFTGIRLAD